MRAAAAFSLVLAFGLAVSVVACGHAARRKDPMVADSPSAASRTRATTGRGTAKMPAG